MFQFKKGCVCSEHKIWAFSGRATLIHERKVPKKTREKVLEISGKSRNKFPKQVYYCTNCIRKIHELFPDLCMKDNAGVGETHMTATHVHLNRDQYDVSLDDSDGSSTSKKQRMSHTVDVGCQ